MNIVQGIYVKSGDNGFFNAESRIVEIIGKYGEQEKKKISAAYEKDRMAFPVDDAAWESSLAAAPRPSTSRPRRPRSGQRSLGPAKRRREASTSSGPPAAPPQPSQAQVSMCSHKPNPAAPRARRDLSPESRGLPGGQTSLQPLQPHNKAKLHGTTQPREVLAAVTRVQQEDKDAAVVVAGTSLREAKPRPSVQKTVPCLKK